MLWHICWLREMLIPRPVNKNRLLKIYWWMNSSRRFPSAGLGLQQTTGLAVVADKLNFMRYASHFRCLHRWWLFLIANADLWNESNFINKLIFSFFRGAFFAGMQTTEVRKLLPESWGFLCPVHTPDGSPCGLMNHLSYTCELHIYNAFNTHNNLDEIWWNITCCKS